MIMEYLNMLKEKHSFIFLLDGGFAPLIPFLFFILVVIFTVFISKKYKYNPQMEELTEKLEAAGDQQKINDLLGEGAKIARAVRGVIFFFVFMFIIYFIYKLIFKL